MLQESLAVTEEEEMYVLRFIVQLMYDNGLINDRERGKLLTEYVV